MEECKTFYQDIDVEYSGDLICKVIANMSRRYIGNKVLDVGAGNGALLKSINPKTKTGIDTAPKSYLVQKGDCSQMEFPDESFDTVFCTDVIEHLSDSTLALCLSEVYRVLKKGGYAIFTTNNKENLMQRMVHCPKCNYGFNVNGHCQSFTIERITKLLNKFEIIKIRTLNLGLIATFGWIAKLFYFLRLHKLKPVYRITSDMFIIVRK